MTTRKPSKPAAATKVSRRKIYSAPALEKGLDIIELLAREPEAINLKEIGERLGRSVGEIFRMLAVLEQRGFVRTIVGSERYQLTMKLFQLAHWHLPVNSLTRAAAGPMRRLALRTGQSCHLSILAGTTIVVLSRQESFNDRSFSIRVGTESPLLESCSGRIFFALADDYMREALLSKISEEGGEIEPAEQIAKLAPKIRKSGLLEIRSDQVEGIVDIGTPIFRHDGQMTASLVIPFMHRIDKDNWQQLETVRSALVEAASEISEALGAE